MDESESDEALMVRVQADDRDAYVLLHGRWRERLFAFLLRRCGARSEAEEALQETWLRVYRWRQRYDRSRPFRPWIFAIATNAGRDAYRPEPHLFELDVQPGEPGGLRDLVVSALAALDADDRRLLLLAIEGFEGPEIAQMLGITAGAVRVRLSRARARVRAAVRGQDA
jgi:RNA polymerase sigma-70 factor (ECF subfamily)